jgi:methylated-DNA-[protein]-cysteine S-methyltransferase
MKPVAYCLFETPLGTCGLAWSEREPAGGPPAVAFLQLPEETPALTETRLARKSAARRADAPPRPVAELIARVCRHLRGDVDDFRDVTLDLGEAGAFARQVYEAARAIPPGETRTYGDLARAVNRPGAARAVGHALGRNPVALIVPCHRVVGAGGGPGGFSAHGGLATKATMLAIEGVAVGPVPKSLF